jgi:chitinase
MRKSWLLWCTTAAIVCGLLADRGEAQGKGHRKAVIGYIFANRGEKLDPATIAAEKVTRINYAFFRLQGGVIAERGEFDADNLAVLTGLKRRNPELQVVVSVGGGNGASEGFSDIALTSEGRKKFVDSAASMVEKYNLDGIDVDWEYPGYTNTGTTVRPQDKDNYTALLKQMRLRFDVLGRKLNRHLITSSATGATRIWLNHTHMREASRWLDSVNMMCYDWYFPVDRNTGHDSPLYTSPADPKAISIDHAVRMYLAAGVPKEKLVIGVPFYGKQWTGVDAGTTHGLWQPIAGGTSGSYVDYWQIEQMENAPGFVRYWDAAAKSPYLYNAAARTFITYNDAEAELSRARYVKAKELQGIMFWQYTGDPKNVLLNAINKGFGWSP